MRRLILLPVIVLLALSCSDKNPVNTSNNNGIAIVNCIMAPSKVAKTAELKPTTSAEISFYDSQNTLLVKQSLTVSGSRVSGSVAVKAGNGYRAELFCYDEDSNITHSGTASNINIVAGQQTTVTILLSPAVPDAPAANGPQTSVTSGTEYTISWEEVSRAKSYTIEEASNIDFSNATTKTIVGTSESFTQNVSQTYYYRIRANNSSGNSGWSNTVTVAIKEKQFNLTITVNQSGWGTTTPAVGPYSYDENSVVVITALPAEGYRFVNWTGDVADPGNATTTVTLTGVTTVTAVFEEEPETQYTLTLAVNNSAWGETFPAVGGNQYIDGTTVSITAVPADGYRFVSWSGVVADATSATTTVTVTANSTVTAIFEKLPIGKYSLTMTVNQPGWGTTDPPPGASTHDDGSIVTITATPASGYRFVNWTGTVADASSATTTVTLNANVTATANFEVISTPQFTLTMAVNQSGWGTTNPASGSYTYDEGTEVTITAIPAEGYRFVNWTGNVADSGNATTTVTLTGDTTVTAVFEEEPETQYTLTLAVNNSAWGETFPAVGDNMYAEGSTVSITAVPADGYRFVSWSGIVADATSATTTVSVTANSTVTAIFEKLPVGKYSLTMMVNQPGWGTTDPPPGASTHDDGSIVTITATPASGYRFINWTGTVADAGSATTTVTLDANVTVTANFEVISTPQFTLTMAVNQSGWGTTNPSAGANTYDENTVVTITATPAAGYRFVNWTGGVADANSYTTTVTMTGDKTVMANFEKITITPSEITMVTIPGGSFQMGDIQGGGESDELPVHDVTLTGFEMSTTEITQGQYESIAGSNPSKNFGVGDYYPVYNVHWHDAVTFCNKLSDSAGLDKCYNESTGACDFTKNGFRLPTEAEWEYACRAGTTTAYYTGGSESDLAHAGWYDVNSSNVAHPVGQKTPNAWGLYDMHGNEWEWCNDWYGSYSSESVTNPTGAQTGSSRVFRGGGWGNGGGFSRSASRNANDPYAGNVGIGFRVVRGAFTPAKIQHTLTIGVNQSGWGTTNPSVGSHTYDEGTEVTIIATPAEGYQFVSWTGDVADANSATTTVTMSGDRTVTANFEEIPAPSHEITMVSITGGSFQMGDISGDGNDDERPVHSVTLSSFEMGKYEITQEQYEAIMGENPSSFSGTNLPVEQVSWFDAVKFCNALSDAAGFDRCYNESTWSCDFRADGFRLPTEAEWEYACRAGTETKYHTGSSESDLGRAGWYDSNSNSKTHPVGQKEPNAFSLYDMHGNVHEWCNDWYVVDYYSSSPSSNPVGPNFSTRVRRGGNWSNDANFCRSADRSSNNPDTRINGIGFRVVRRPNE